MSRPDPEPHPQPIDAMEAPRVRARRLARSIARPRVAWAASATIVVAAAVAGVGCSTSLPPITIEEGPDAEVTADGLHRVKGGVLNLAFLKPGARLDTYTKVLIEPVTIAYKRPPRSGRHAQARDSNFLMTPAQEAEMQRVFHDAFVAEVAKSEFFTVTEEPGPDTLRLQAGIIDLIVRVPTQTLNSPNERVYVHSIGEMTLVLAMIDSQTREVLARVADRREARRASGSDLSRSTPSGDWAQVRFLFSRWADILRRRLDEAHTLRLEEAGEAPEGDAAAADS